MSKFTGLWLLDEIDIYEAYGVILSPGSYQNLLSAPKRKEPLKNNWREENGEEVDLELARYEAMDVSINFSLIADKTEFQIKEDSFLAALKADGEREFIVTPLSKLFKLYYKEQSNKKLYKNTQSGKWASTFTIKFGMNLTPAPLDVDPPLAPSNLSIDSVTSSSFRVVWQDNSDNEEGFEVIYSKSSTFATGNIVRTAGINGQQLTISGLDSNSTYYVKVRAFNKLKTQFSAYTSTLSQATTQATVPTPANFTVTAGNGHNTLNWNAVSIAQNYLIQFHSGDSNWQTIGAYDGVTVGFVHESLTNGTTYYYRLAGTASGYLQSNYTTAFGMPQESTTGGTGTTEGTPIEATLTGSGSINVGLTTDNVNVIEGYMKVGSLRTRFVLTIINGTTPEHDFQMIPYRDGFDVFTSVSSGANLSLNYTSGLTIEFKGRLIKL